MLCVPSLSVVSESAALRAVAHSAFLLLGFFWQEYWSGLPFPPSGMEHVSPVAPALAGGFSSPEPPGKPTATVEPSI